MREHEVPVPRGRDVLLRVMATSLNYRERMIIVDGVYSLPLKPDLIPACDGAGEVITVGPDVATLRAGDRVAASVFPRWLDGPFDRRFADQLGGSLDGMLSEYVLLDEDALVRIPPHLTYEEAATFPCAGVTAWHALTAMAAPLAGETILILGSGSVALFALTFARAFGVRTIIVTSSPAKAARLRELGADHTIDYHESPDWQVVVRELTDGRGVDRVVELGGAATLGRSIAAVALSGRIALVGALGGAAQIAASALAGNVYSLERISLGSRAHFEAMNRSVAQHELRPVIDRVYPFDEAPAAFADLIERERVGKVVIRVAV